LVCAIAAWALAAPATVQAAAEVTPDGMRGLEPATRVVVVAANGSRATHASVRTYARAATDTAWRRARDAMPARLGASGLRAAARRHEGDGSTPMGDFGFVYGFGSQPDPGVTELSWRRLTPAACWAASRAHYNRWIDQRPCAGEALWPSAGRAYRYAAVIDFNYRRPVYGRGSGIFLHVQTGRPTRGCVSLGERDLLGILRWLRPGARIVIGTTAYLRSLKQ
jgi:L,D-peptidoglycan transpeptidase YkuD (ErfK/YbiS/YcfS/YnhG family)